MTKIFSRIAVPLLGRLISTNLIIPYYHMVCDDDSPHVKHLYGYKSVREFREDVDFLLANYRPVSLQEVLDHVKNGHPLKGKSFLLTFDDGFREMSDVVAPILFDKGVSAVFFINSAFTDNRELCYLNKASVLIERLRDYGSAALEERLSGILREAGAVSDHVRSAILSLEYAQREVLDEIARVMDVEFSDYLSVRKPYLTSEQIRRMAENGFSIGGHSIDHPLYESIPMEEQLRQTTESVMFVRKTFGLEYGVFAFPHSDRGVSRDFFARLSDAGLVDLSFGTGGLLKDSVHGNLQRFSMEKPLMAAREIIAFQQARKIKKYVTMGARIART